MKKRDCLADVDKIMTSIEKGAFLTVKANGELNTMAIGWATIGLIWFKKILMVAVRDSRHTFTLLEKSKDFTVSIPFGDSYKKSIAFCGTKSGRDFNKYEECDLNIKDSIAVQSPIIDAPGIQYECNIVYKAAMDENFIAPNLTKIYPKKDFHTLYFGEILECYETE